VLKYKAPFEYCQGKYVLINTYAKNDVEGGSKKGLNHAKMGDLLENPG
jgi:hypothetical protein